MPRIVGPDESYPLSNSKIQTGLWCLSNLVPRAFPLPWGMAGNRDFPPPPPQAKGNALGTRLVFDLVLDIAHIILLFTRHGSINLVCPKFQRTCDGGRTFTVSGIKLWNSLPADIRKTDNINNFKAKLRTFF